MKMNIEIVKKGTRFLETDETLAEITICNGNWKYNDRLMETDEKISLTINNLCESSILMNPVKDAYPIHNHEEALENHNLIVEKAIIRAYDNLLTYLNYRINNTKEEYKKYGWTERTYTIVMFEETVDREDITTAPKYNKHYLVEVHFEVMT